MRRCDAAVANRCLRATSTVAPPSDGPCRRRPAARRSGHAQAACNSPRNAGIPAASAQLVCITHPFHPFSGRQLVCVGERYNRSGKRLLLRVDDRTICSVPPTWTDVSVPDPEVTIGRERALFTVADLMELALLVRRLSLCGDAESSSSLQGELCRLCKVINAAYMCA